MDCEVGITDRVTSWLVGGRDIIRRGCIYKCEDRTDNVWTSMWWILSSVGNKREKKDTIKDVNEIEHIEWISTDRKCGYKIIRYK